MSGEACTCGAKFMDPEDFRDHLPCPGSEAEQARRQGRAEMLREILAALRDPIDYKGSLTIEVASGMDWAAGYLEGKFKDGKG